MESLRTELLAYSRIFETELHDDILAFWIKYAVEKDGDGFYGAVDMTGNPIPDAPRSCVLNARILWTFAEAAKNFDNRQYAEIAARAYQVLAKYFADPVNGGYLMSITSGNKPLDDH